MMSANRGIAELALLAMVRAPARDEASELAGNNRVDCVPPIMIDQAQTVRYRLDLTEGQLKYLYDLVSVDEGENAENLSSKHFEELVGMLVYHKQGIDGPSE